MEKCARLKEYLLGLRRGWRCALLFGVLAAVLLLVCPLAGVGSGTSQDANAYSKEPPVFAMQLSKAFDIDGHEKEEVQKMQAWVMAIVPQISMTSQENFELMWRVFDLYRRQKARVYNDYVTLLQLFEDLALEVGLRGNNLVVWKQVLAAKLDKRGVRVAQLKEFIQWTRDFTREGVIQKSPSVMWRALTDKMTFEADGEFIKINIPTTTLRCYAMGDSIEILDAGGTYTVRDRKFIGEEGGRITWERAGLDPERVYAIFNSDLKIDMKSNTVEVMMATFFNRDLLEESLMGKVTYKCLNRKNSQGMRYPRFESGNFRMNKKDLFPGVNYSGGFTQTGQSFLATGSYWLPAEVTLHRGDTTLVSFEAPSFIISPHLIQSQAAQVKLRLGDEGELYHPGVRFTYNNDTKILQLVRGNKGIEKRPYTDSYHKMSISAELVEWKIDEPRLYLKSLVGASESKVELESDQTYSEELDRALQGMNSIHPLAMVAEFSRINGGGNFQIKEFADYYQLTVSAAKQMMFMLTNQGFVNYMDQAEAVAIEQRLYDFLDFSFQRKDYDNIRFYSTVASNDTTLQQERRAKFGYMVNGYIDLNTLDLDMTGIPGIPLSESSGVYIFPDKGEMKMKQNHDIEFDGNVLTGQTRIQGKNFRFDYDQFTLDLDSVEHMYITVIDSSQGKMANGKYPTIQIPNTLNDFTGTIVIDRPDNKSGRVKNDGYPRVSSDTPGKIYYDDKRTQHGLYTKETFYFTVDTFTIKDVNAIGKNSMPLEGELVSNIFPVLRQKLEVRPDKSLGFELDTPDEGYPIYGGKATFYQTIDLSNQGLRGVGEIDYVTSKCVSKAQKDDPSQPGAPKRKNSKEDYFTFAPEMAFGTTRQFDCVMQGQNPNVPHAELGINQSYRDANNYDRPGETWMAFYPKKDRMELTNTMGKFYMFPTDKVDAGFDCILDGTLTVTPQALLGTGRADIGTSVLESECMVFTDHTLAADTSYFASYEYEDGKRRLLSGELRQDIIDQTKRDTTNAFTTDELQRMKAGMKSMYYDTVGRVEKIYKSLASSQTLGVEEKPHWNKTTLANDAVHRIKRGDTRRARDLDNRFWVTLIDFNNREGYFKTKNADGNERTFAAVKYVTTATSITWNIDTNEETIGEKGGSGNRFEYLKREGGRSLNFMVPVAHWYKNEKLLKCDEVVDMKCADMLCTLHKEDPIFIREGGAMDTLTLCTIDIKNDSIAHQFAEAKVKIKGAMTYQASGKYTFIDNEQGANVIEMTDIHTVKGVTEAQGDVYEPMPLDKYFAFQGRAKVSGMRRLLAFDGGAQMRQDCKQMPKGFIRFNAILDPAKVRIPVNSYNPTRMFNSFRGNATDKALEIYNSFRVSADTPQVYSTFLEPYHLASDRLMLRAPDDKNTQEQWVLYHNGIWDRFEVCAPTKIQNPDTCGTLMAFSPKDKSVSAYGAINFNYFLRSKGDQNPSFRVRSAGDIKHNRETNTLTANVLQEMDFFLLPEVTTVLYNDLLASDAPECDSMSYSFITRLDELCDTTEKKSILRMRQAPLVEVLVDKIPVLQLPESGPIFTFDKLLLTWNSQRHAYETDTVVNLMMMKYRKVNRQVHLKADFVLHKDGKTKIRMLLSYDNKWYFFDYRVGAKGYNRISVSSNNEAFESAVTDVDVGKRRNRDYNTEYIIAPKEYLQAFEKAMGGELSEEEIEGEYEGDEAEDEEAAEEQRAEEDAAPKEEVVITEYEDTESESEAEEEAEESGDRKHKKRKGRGDDEPSEADLETDFGGE